MASICRSNLCLSSLSLDSACLRVLPTSTGICPSLGPSRLDCWGHRYDMRHNASPAPRDSRLLILLIRRGGVSTAGSVSSQIHNRAVAEALKLRGNAARVSWPARASARSRAPRMHRKAIAAYVRAAVATGVRRGGTPPTDARLTAIATARRAGRPTNMTAPSPELERLRPQAAAIRQWLAEGLRLTKIYRRLRAAGIDVSYSSSRIVRCTGRTCSVRLRRSGDHGGHGGATARRGGRGRFRCAGVLAWTGAPSGAGACTDCW